MYNFKSTTRTINNCLNNNQPAGNFKISPFWMSSGTYDNSDLALSRAREDHYLRYKSESGKYLNKISSLNLEISELEKEINELKRTKEEKENSLQDLEAEAKSRKDAHWAASEQYESLKSRAYSVWREEDKLEAAIKTWKKKINQLSEDITANNYRNDALRQRDINTKGQYEKFRDAEIAKLTALPTEEQLLAEADEVAKSFMPLSRTREAAEAKLKAAQDSLKSIEKTLDRKFNDLWSLEYKRDQAEEKFNEAIYNLSYLPKAENLASLKCKVFQLYLDMLKEEALKLEALERLSSKEDFESEEEMEEAIKAGERLEAKENELSMLLRNKEEFGETLQICFNRKALEENQNNLQYWLDKDTERINRFSEKMPLWKQSQQMTW